VRCVSLPELEAMLMAPGNDNGKGLVLTSREGALVARDLMRAANMH